MRTPTIRPLALAAGACLLALSTAVSAAPFSPPQPVERTLPNGLRVLVVPQPRLAIVQIQLLVPGGSSLDPAGQEGAAALTAQILKRGTTSRTADAYQADIDRLGGTVSAQAARDFSMLSGSFLARDLEAGLELMSNAVLDPVFPESEFQRLRQQSVRMQLQARGNPAGVADEQTWVAALSGNPYGRPVLGTSRSIAALTVESLRAYHRDVWRPDHAVLAIGGDVTPERAFAAAADWFSRWSGRSAASAPISPPIVPTRPRIALQDLPGMGWAEVRLALIAPSRRAGDEAVALATSALVGGGDSRLASRRNGVAGAAPRGGLSQLRDGGLITIGVAVPPDSVASAVKQLRAELRGYVKTPPAEAELAPLRRAFVNSFPLAFETLSGALSQWQSAALDGRSAEDVARTPALLAGVTADAVAAATRRWFDPEHALIVVAGPADRVRPQLEALGTVEDLSLDAIVPLSANNDTLATATPERVAQGRAAVARAIAAHGGLERLRGIRDSEVISDMTLTLNGRDLLGQVTSVRKEAYKLLTQTRFLGLTTKQVLNGTIGWSQADVDSVGMPMDSLAVRGMRASFEGDPAHVLLVAADSAATVIARGTGAVGTTETDDVEVITAAGERRRYHFDKSTGRLLQLDQYSSADSWAEVLTRRIYADFKEADGVIWPFKEERRSPGDNIMRLDVKSVRLNQGVSDATFVRPMPEH